jgi:flagellar hook protein FlgE
MLFSDMLSVNIGNSSQIGRGTQIQKVDNVFGQGSFESTESVTDIALQGNSFFALKTPAQGSPLTSQSQATLTRAGAFRLDASKFLVNPDGYQVVDTAGNAIQFTDNATAIASALTAYTPTATTSWSSISSATVPAMYATPAGASSTAATNALTAAQTALTAAQAASTAQHPAVMPHHCCNCTCRTLRSDRSTKPATAQTHLPQQRRPLGTAAGNLTANLMTPMPLPPTWPTQLPLMP